VVKVEGLQRSFGSLAVLDQVSFTALDGEFVAIVGPSGCGKTVLLRILAGLTEVTSGSASTGTRAAYAFQRSPLFPWLSLFENVSVCAPEASAATINEYFRAAGLAGFEGELPGRISGGMRQKVNVIRAFCSGRKVILMDEPFGSLDFPGRLELRELTLELWAREKKTILFVTHDVDEALQLASRVLVFSPRPARLLREIAAPFAYPRDPLELRSNPDYAAAFRAIAGLLTEGR
jgi:NitT/TauT family transport system ATP-binding protein